MSLYWDDRDPRAERFEVPDDILDLAFAIECACLPLDHAQSLSDALQGALPWLAEEGQAGVHLIHGAESGNGWYRPQDPATELLYPSRRTRMTLRLPRDRIADAERLAGRTLDIAGYPLTVGRGSVRKLSDLPTVFARYVITDVGEDEVAFLDRMAAELRGLGITARKVLCGRVHALSLGRKQVRTRSLMVADLDPALSVRLQQQGLGPGRKVGCGLFLPHKGIAPVRGAEESD